MVGSSVGLICHRDRTARLWGFGYRSAPASTGPAIAASLESLAAFAGGHAVRVTGPVPAIWAEALL